MATKSSGASPDKRRKYDEEFKVEALRLASKSRRTQAAARQLGISPKLPAGAGPARGQQAAGAGARYFKKYLVIFGQPTR